MEGVLYDALVPLGRVVPLLADEYHLKVPVPALALSVTLPGPQRWPLVTVGVVGALAFTAKTT